MTAPSDNPLRVGFLTIGRKRPGFDPEWGCKTDGAAWEACAAAGLDAVRPPRPVVDDATLREAVEALRTAGCQTLLVLQPTMGDGRLAPILAQLWGDPLVFWATPERPDSDRVSACSLVGAHVFASTLRQLGRPFEIVYGPPEDAETRQQVATAARLTAAAAALARSKVGLVGYHAPGFINMLADPVALNRELGIQLHHFGLAELIARIDACEPDRVKRDLSDVAAMDLPRADDLADEDLVPNSRYYLALSDLMAEEHLDALAVRCWPELPNHYGHWPYLAMLRMAGRGLSVALEGDVDGAILGLIGRLCGLGPGYLSDWLAHDRQSITLWHPGHAQPSICLPDSLRLGRHFNDNRPLVVNGQLAPERPITLARLWRCDGRYHLTAFAAQTAAPQRVLLGACGRAIVAGPTPVPTLFDRLCHAGTPHHVTLFPGEQVEMLRRMARLLGIDWLDPMV